MSCQGKCEDCSYWDGANFCGWGKCGLATVKASVALYANTPVVPEVSGDCDLLTREDFGCNQFCECQGREFVKLIGEIYRTVNEEYGDIPRKAYGVAFSILALLDGSGEHWSGESRYRVFAEEDGEWRLVEFQHHDLDSGK